MKSKSFPVSQLSLKRSLEPESLEILSSTLFHFLSQTQENDLRLETPLCQQYTHFLHLECRLTYDPNVRAVAKPLRFDKYVYAIFTS